MDSLVKLSNLKITVVGLGYVGLPLAIELSKHFPVKGFDINETRIQELTTGYDRTNEIEEEELRSSTLELSCDFHSIQGSDIYIITVPTPIDGGYKPDLGAVKAASRTVGKAMKKGSIVVYESTVYPGVTEEICIPILEEVSGLRNLEDFYVGYSPERINPGDKVHTLSKITKVVSGQTPEVRNLLSQVYGSINQNNIFAAESIKVAEAAKVIENAQRDLNVAFMNELTAIFSKMNISIYDVLEAASTKWNFLHFKPGLVGGHCIGVDPYYLVESARKVGFEPEVLVAGRAINEKMGSIIGDLIHQRIHEIGVKKAKILLLGITFKENVPDLRNSKVISLINSLQEFGHEIDLHDPVADFEEVKHEFNLSLQTKLNLTSSYDVVIGTVAHRSYFDFTEDTFSKLLKEEGFVYDIKKIWDRKSFSKIKYYTI
jgi:UDP-N-acetyl-D-galactosamine dehydrogenase